MTKMIQSPIHLNLNIFASVAIETTGPYVGLHDVVRVCIIPLTSFYEPAPGVTPLLATFQPIYEEHPWVNNETYPSMKLSGIPADYAPDIFKLWASKLPKQKDKKLVPISHEWPFTSAFLKALIGPDTFEEIFAFPGRDLSAAAAYVNDCCDMSHDQVPFPKVELGSICNRLSVQIDKPRDALNNAQAVARAYKAIIKRMYKGQVL